MSIMLRAALAAVSLANIAPAYAGEAANTRFTETPGVAAVAPAQNAPLARRRSMVRGGAPTGPPGCSRLSGSISGKTLRGGQS